MPLKLTSEEHVKKMGDFRLDRIWVKSWKFTNDPRNGSKQQLTIEVLPFAYLDNGERVFFDETVKKILFTDVESYLMETGDVDFLNTYSVMEATIARLITERTEWTAEQVEV